MATIAEFFVFTLNYTWRYYTKDEHLNYKQHKGLDSALLTCAIDIRSAPSGLSAILSRPNVT